MIGNISVASVVAEGQPLPRCVFASPFLTPPVVVDGTAVRVDTIEDSPGIFSFQPRARLVYYQIKLRV
jgi:hypothetical protein